MYAVAAARPEAVRAGMEILSEGGDACDCAAAVSLMLGVAEPFYSGLGGGGVALIWREKEGTARFVDFNNECSRHAGPGMFPHDAQGKHLTEEHSRGHRSALVPGLLRGLEALHREFGTLPWSRLFEPGIQLAKEGFPVGWFYLKHQADARFGELLEADSGLAEIHTNNGERLAEGNILRQPLLEATLRKIAENGADEFYSGEIGAALVEEIRGGGGLIDEEDLAGYRVRNPEPLSGTYRGLPLLTVPLPSSGLLLIQILNLMECLAADWEAMEERERLAAFARAMQAAFQDRFAIYGDPLHVEVPVEKLMSKDYAAEIARKKSSPSSHNHDRNPGSTTHFTVVDREGNIVCLTQTLGMAWGSGMAVPGTGIIVNNHTYWMDPRPGRGNSIGPRKRPMAGYAPTLFFRDGRPWLAIGSPGSYRIPTAVAQVLLNRFHHGMTLQESVEAPRIHFDAGPLEVEGNLPEGLSDALRDGQFGLSRRPYLDHFFGGVNAVEMGEEGELFTGADPRRSCASEIAG